MGMSILYVARKRNGKKHRLSASVTPSVMLASIQRKAVTMTKANGMVIYSSLVDDVGSTNLRASSRSSLATSSRAVSACLRDGEKEKKKTRHPASTVRTFVKARFENRTL